MYNKTKIQYTITYKKQPFYDFYFDVELLNFQYDKVYLTNSDFVVIIMFTIHVHETNLASKIIVTFLNAAVYLQRDATASSNKL